MPPAAPQRSPPLGAETEIGDAEGPRWQNTHALPYRPKYVRCPRAEAVLCRLVLLSFAPDSLTSSYLPVFLRYCIMYLSLSLCVSCACLCVVVCVCFISIIGTAHSCDSSRRLAVAAEARREPRSRKPPLARSSTSRPPLRCRPSGGNVANCSQHHRGITGFIVVLALTAGWVVGWLVDQLVGCLVG